MEVAMKTSLLVLVILSLVVGGALGVMNNACKTGHHVWCKSAHVSDMPRSKSGSS
jgi:hypothetical protein